MTVTGIITALIVGLIIGALGRLVVPGRQNIPIWLTMVDRRRRRAARHRHRPRPRHRETTGIDWLELLLQVALAAVGVALVAGMGRRRRMSRM